MDGGVYAYAVGWIHVYAIFAAIFEARVFCLLFLSGTKKLPTLSSEQLVLT